MLTLLIALSQTGSLRAEPFDVAKARKRMAEFEQTYRSGYEDGVCRYYGRKWRTLYAMKETVPGSGKTVWDQFVGELARKRQRAKRLDCTLYAQEILKAGMTPKEYRRLLEEHRKIWKACGFAGWSVAHLLTEKHGWTAYAVIGRDAPYYHYYLRHLKRGEYPVWRQPNIKIQGFFLFKRDRREIERLLRRRRFGWGFSEGGIHTWITSGANLKENHYDKGPSRKYDIPASHPLFEAMNLRSNPLFKTTRFVEFHDYHVHLIVFPPPPQ